MRASAVRSPSTVGVTVTVTVQSPAAPAGAAGVVVTGRTATLHCRPLAIGVQVPRSVVAEMAVTEVALAKLNRKRAPSALAGPKFRPTRVICMGFPIRAGTTDGVAATIPTSETESTTGTSTVT